MSTRVVHSLWCRRAVRVLAIAAALLVSPITQASQADVERVLKEMQDAVLAGDARAYLRRVSTADTQFRIEQDRWAADLERHRPIAFTLALAQPAPDSADADHPSDFGDDLARCQILMSWTMPGLGDGGTNLTRTLRLPVRFVREQDETSGQRRWVFAGEDWLAAESLREVQGEAVPASHRARALFMPGYENLGQRVLSEMPVVRSRVHEGLERTVDRVQSVKLYPSQRHLQASISLSYVEPLGGWNEPGESIKLVASARTPPATLRVLLAHEYAHVVCFEMGAPMSGAPWWVLEGVAELASQAVGGPSPDARVIEWAKSGELRAFDELADFKAVPPELHKHVYKQGHHMVSFISDRFGRRGRNNWLSAMGSGKTLHEATRQTLGVSFDELDRQWRAGLSGKARGAP